MAGVTSSGFVAKTIEDLTADLEAAFRRVIGKAANVDPRSRVGQLIGIFAQSLSEVWELAEGVVGALDPDAAGGAQLDALCALTGTVRKPATYGTVDLLCMGTPATAIAVGKRVGVNGTSTVFETTAGGSMAAASAWAATTVYSAGAYITADGAIWRADNAGTSSSTPPSGAGPFVDGTVTWERMGDGTGYVVLAAQATATGPLQGYAGTCTVIQTPVAGWSSANNPVDAVPGTNLETDAELRVRRRQEIAAIGSSPIDAIRAKILRVAGVSTAIVFQNDTDATVGTIGPHGLELLVEGGDDAAIRAALFAAVAGGIATFGTTSGAVVDSAGNSHTVKHSRPTTVNAYVAIVLEKDPALYPADGDDQVKAAVQAWGDALPLGRDIVPSAILAQVFTIPGVLDVTSVLVGLSGPPASSSPITLTIRERADYDTGRITVSSTDGVA